ncbi:hypothetical protein DYB36_001496 [Aphanomyces astaci]|uniref:EF-hand domain-containing protein n=1 Tax=Aphanomyces astaci TaxID=112090 RepID=A0A396ZVM2_APHAT|nr:hypothetical protein DYB36_001496 [Aphanomyces astaci]
MSPAKPKKDLVGPPPQTPSPSTPTPPVATPAAADPSKPIPDALPSSPSLAPDVRRAVNDTPDFETPLGIFGPQLQQRETEDLCFAIGMTTLEVQKLVAIFNDIDLNCSGLINLRELYFLLDTPQNKYTSSILRFSTHQSDPVKLDIDDFVRIVCTFALMSQTDIYRFCFDTFDEDDSGSLSKDEFVVMCDSIQIKGDGFFQGNFKKAMEAFDANHDGLLDFAEFIEMNRKFPLVFWPLFHFQETMQEKTLGKRMWTKIRARQLQIDAWRHYMKRFLGRAPPPTWKERWCGCISTDQRLRLIAAQLYDQDQLHLKMQTKSHPGGKRTEPDRKMLQRGTSKGEASSRNTKHSALPTTSSTSTTGSRTNHVGNPTHK